MKIVRTSRFGEDFLKNHGAGKLTFKIQGGTSECEKAIVGREPFLKNQGATKLRSRAPQELGLAPQELEGEIS